MFGMDVWTILEIIAILFAFVAFRRRQRFIWGGFVLGVLISVVIFTINEIQGTAAIWGLYKKIITLSTFAGILVEYLRVFRKSGTK